MGKILNKKNGMEWTDDSPFEEFFEEFSKLLQSMATMDFSQRITQRNVVSKKDDVLDFLTESLNHLNQELELSYINVNLIPVLMSAFKVENRIVLISKDSKNIHYSFSNSKHELINSKVSMLTGRMLYELFDEEQIKHSNQETINFSGKLNPNLFSGLEENEAHFNITTVSEHTVVVITLHPESSFIKNHRRILSFISLLRQQYEDNPSMTNTAVGIALSMEVKELYDELRDYMESEGFLVYQR